MNDNKGFNISKKAFLGSILAIFTLMVITYILTFIIPSGTFVRTVNESGKEVIDMTVGYKECEGGISFLKFIFSPFLTFTGSNSTTMIEIIVFLLVLGGVFNTLSKSGLMNYALNKIAHKYASSRYKLLVVVSLFFMFTGGFVGTFEEAIPLVPICVALCVSLGFDTLTGLAISLLAVGCGFSSGVLNAFTVGIAQSLAGLAMFSGISLRLLSFVLIYALLITFILMHAKKVASDIKSDSFEHKIDPLLEKGLKSFIIIMGIAIVIVLLSPIITVIQPYTIIVIALGFLLTGIISPTLMQYKNIGKDFLDGAITMLPAALMVMMASSICYILEESKTLDTILNFLINVAGGLDKWVLVLFIYLIVLVMNFFVSSGSAKAFMLMPIIIPIASVFGISSQLCVLAFAFGDGFSNVFYPTNAGLLVSLSLSDTSYLKWAKFSLPFQLINLLLTSGILLLGLNIGY